MAPRTQFNEEGLPVLTKTGRINLMSIGVRNPSEAIKALTLDAGWNPPDEFFESLRNTPKELRGQFLQDRDRLRLKTPSDVRAAVALASEATLIKGYYTIEAYELALNHPHADTRLVHDAALYCLYNVHANAFETQRGIVAGIARSPHLTRRLFNDLAYKFPLYDTTASESNRAILNHSHADEHTIRLWVNNATHYPKNYGYLAPTLADPAWPHAHLLTDEDKSRLLVVAALT